MYAHPAGQCVGDVACRPTVVTRAVDEHAATLYKLRQLFSKLLKAVVGSSRLIVGDIDDAVCRKIGCGGLLCSYDFPTADLSALRKVV